MNIILTNLFQKQIKEQVFFFALIFIFSTSYKLDDKSHVIYVIFQVIPQLSCPIALFTYYNPILKRGVDKFMSIIEDVGVRGTCSTI